MGWRNKAFFSVLLSCISLQAYAMGYHSSDARQCKIAIKYYEGKYEIPTNLLQSIALIESGRWDKQAKKHYPWPWTVNVEGKPYFFESKYQAVKFVKEQIKSGKKSIDVGCNQINLYHHGEKFSSLDQVFNPVINSHYAAKFLKSHFDNTKDWSSAVARYHSHTPELGSAYAGKVFLRWNEYLKEKLPVNSFRKTHGTITNVHQYKQPKPKVTKHKKSSRSREGIIVFSRNKIHIDPKQNENNMVVAISERMLKQY